MLRRCAHPDFVGVQRYGRSVSRYRLLPTPAQEAELSAHCRHVRFVWNLAVEQYSYRRPGRTPPGYSAQSRQLTEARTASSWLADGSFTVQQQALRDFHQAMAGFFRGTHRRPTWRKAGRHEGFRQVGVKPTHVRKLNRRFGVVQVPKVGLVRFRWTRPLVPGVKSYRVTCDRAGRWHIAFAVVPPPLPAPGNGRVVGVDRGVAVSAALSTGELLHCPGLSLREQDRLLRLRRRLARSKPRSNRRTRVRILIGRLLARERDRRRDWVEKLGTRLALEFDVIRVEALDVRAMTRSAKNNPAAASRGIAAKAGLNRAILGQGWGSMLERLEHKAQGRVQRINAAYTSQICSACGHCAQENRKSQAVFRCTACSHAINADVNAARNIAAGPVVTARGGLMSTGPTNREPQLVTSAL
jgi:putative transposase